MNILDHCGNQISDGQYFLHISDMDIKLYVVNFYLQINEIVLIYLFLTHRYVYSKYGYQVEDFVDLELSVSGFCLCTL